MKRWLWCGVAALLVLAMALGTWWLRQTSVQTQLDEIRARGEPVTFAELDQFLAVVPADRDVTVLVMQAGDDIDSRSKSAAIHNLPIVGQGPPPPPPGTAWPQLADVKQYLADNATALTQLHQLKNHGDQPRLSPLDSAGAVSKTLHRVQPLRACARVLQLETNVRAHEGDSRGVADSIECGVLLSQTLADEPWLVSQLVRCALFGMAGHELKRTLPALDFSDDDLQELQRAIAAVDFTSSLKLTLLGERVGGLAQYESFFGGNDWRSKFLRITFREDQRHFLSIINEFLALADKPWPDMLAESKMMAQQIKANPSRQHVLSDASVQSFSAMIEAFARGEMTRRLLVVAVALERYRLRHGHPPAEFAALAPEYLETVPDDPIEGAPFHYQATNAGYLLFSPTQRFPIPSGEQPDAETGANPNFVFRWRAQRAQSTAPDIATPGVATADATDDQNNKNSP